MATRPAAEGFTLVELLVALMLFALITAFSVDAVRFSGAAWDNVSSEALAMDQEISVQRFLRERFEGVSRPGNAAPEVGESVQWWLAGEQNEVEFVGSWYRGAVPPGLYMFHLRHEVRDGIGQLLLAWEPRLPGASEEARAELSGERVLAEGIAALSLRYFGAASPDAQPDWHTTWSEGSMAPALVELVISWEDTGDRWPRLVVATGHGR